MAKRTKKEKRKLKRKTKAAHQRGGASKKKLNKPEKIINPQNLETLLREGERWASLSVTIKEIANDNKKLIKDLSEFDPNTTIPLLSSLQTLPDYQSNCIRLEILVALAVAFCDGNKESNIHDVARWFHEIGQSQCVYGEDPSEDIFVSLVQDQDGDYRVLEGAWESAGFYTRLILGVVSTMPDNGIFVKIKKGVKSILIISDFLCKNSQLQRYQIGSEEIHSRLSISSIPDRNELISRVTLSFKDLEKCGIELNDLEPFLFQSHMIDHLVSQQVGNSYLDRRPLISTADKHLIISMPSALSVALRDFVIQEVLKNDLVKSFDNALAKKYSQLFSETPLLGGPFNAPVHWKMSGKHRISSFLFQVDVGFFIFYQLFLPSIEYHNDGGFKEIVEDDGALTNELQKFIDSSVQQVSKKAEFKQGLLILVGCGWGKGYATKDIIFNYPSWRFESISAADLIRLSAIEDLNPGYFWKIQEGFDAITRNGVKIINANGILNLISWVRKNNGHFVPHAQLPDEEISVDRPIILHIPTNILRDIRAEADQGYDRHSSFDNMGKLHDVQHHSAKPLFLSESLKKLFVSITDVSKGVLTFVYEGKYQIWLTVLAKNIDDRDVEFRLGEMAREWLHRIGNIFDEHISLISSQRNLKVYAEFQDDTPTNEPKLIQVPPNLASLCEVGDLQEKNSKIAIFKKGFFDGFRVAENIAERWFVFDLVRALLTILGDRNIHDKTNVITGKVIKNTEARSFHIFHTQQFLDYVRDRLPKKLIKVDAINHGIARLRLGWRALNSINIDKKNKITGKDNCRNFLHKVVDILISEISGMLDKFNRKSTLLKLIANCEKAYDEEDHWRKTSSAVLGLHGENEKTLNQYVEQTSKFANAALSSRVLIEMALCRCPFDNGNIISNIELSKLIAKASLLIQYGGLSDAIHYNILPPDLHISALGDILFEDDFGSAVVEPMLSRASSDKYVYGAPHQRKNYDDPVFIETTKQSFDEDFWNIWIAEMGFNIDEGRNIIDSLENEGIERQSLIFELKREDYFKLVCWEKLSKKVAENFLERFTLRTRKRWDKVPIEFASEEIYPWRYGRRLSFVARPILQIEESDDPTLLIAPGSLRKGFVYLVDGTLSGRLKQSFFQTEQMRNDWWGRTKEGHSFNREATEELSKNGWIVRENIELTEILNKKLDRNYGDIDILAWRSTGEEVLIIECKDLTLARNYSEIAALLSTFQGRDDDKGKGDKLKVHLDRVAVMEQSIEDVKKYTGLHEVKIISCLVFSGIVPMQFAKIEALKDTRVGTIEEITRLFETT